VAGLALASQAVAGTYDVLTCEAAPHGENNAWRATSTAPTHFEEGESCPTNGTAESGLYVRDRIGAPFAPNGAPAGWTFAAPASTTITRWQYRRWFGKDGTNSWEVHVRVGDAISDTCTIGDGLPDCWVGAPLGHPQWNGRDLGTITAQSLRFGIRCA